MKLSEQISPRVDPQVARRLRLAALVWERSMSEIVNAALDEKLPSLGEIGQQVDCASHQGSSADVEVH